MTSSQLRFLCSSLAVALACAPSPGPGHHTHAGEPTEAACPNPLQATYENFGRGFMESYCLQCHSQSVHNGARQGAPSDQNFDTLESIRAEAEHIDLMAGAGPAAQNQTMPPHGAAPTAAERQKLAEWLACGAP